MDNALAFLFTMSFLMFLATPLVIAIWMWVHWNRDAKRSLLPGGLAIVVWIVSFTAFLVVYLRGRWYPDASAMVGDVANLPWLLLATGTVIAANAFFVVDALRRHDNQARRK